MLSISEQLFLLAIDDEKGKVVPSVSHSLQYGLAGALIAELVLQGKISIDHEKRITVNEGQSVGNEMMDEILAMMRESKKVHKISFWINALASKKTFKRILARLVDKGILREEEKRYLWIIPYEIYPQQDASAKFWVKLALRSAVLTGGEVETSRLVLLNLVKATGMINFIFTKDERRLAAKQIEKLVESDVIGLEVAKAIADIEAATSTAVIAMMNS